MPQPRFAILLAPPLALTLLVIWQVMLGHRWGNDPLSNRSIIGWTIFLWVLFARLTTVRLLTDVYRDEIVIAMRGFFRKRRIATSSVKSAVVISVAPVADYGGYGIRPTPGGRAYLADTDTGVRFALKDGSNVVVSSRQSDDLANRVTDLIKGLG